MTHAGHILQTLQGMANINTGNILSVYGKRPSSALQALQAVLRSSHHPQPIKDQPVTEIMILEGVSSSRQEFDEYISYRIFVDTPKDVCLERGIARDMGTGKSKDELTKMWQDWFTEESKYMQKDNPKQKANLVIDGTRPFEDQISFEVN